MDEIIAPTANDNFTRFNPVCDKPMVRIKNYGIQELTYCEIAYWVDHTNKYYFDWNGSLQSGETADVELPGMNWSNLDLSNLEFFARVNWPNNLPDQFVHNNEKSTLFEIPAVYNTNALRVRFRTNNKPEENAFTLVASDGTIVANEATFNASTFNTYDYNLSDGCYTFEMTDYGNDWEAGDGLSWWFNTQNNIETSGYVEFRNGANNQIIQSFTRDFGASLRWSFLINSDLQMLTGNSSSTQSFHPETTPYTSPSGEEFLQVYDTIWISEDKIVIGENAPVGIKESIDEYGIEVFPNPTNGIVSLVVVSSDNKEIPVQLLDLLGQQIDVFTVKTNNPRSYDLGELSEGFYLFSFTIDGTKISKKISIFK
jgi:hypothetical protein